MLCTVCGSDNDQRLVFCRNCGNRLQPREARVVAPTPPVGMPQVPLPESATAAAAPNAAAPASAAAGETPAAKLSRPSAPALDFGFGAPASRQGPPGPHEEAARSSPLDRDTSPGGGAPLDAPSASPADRGAPVDEQHCTECGATSPQGYRFCLGCGAVLGHGPVREAGSLSVVTANPDEQQPSTEQLTGQRVVPIEGDTSAAVVVSCTQCGAVCSGGETTCQHCGAPVAGLAPGSAGSRPAPSPAAGHDEAELRRHEAHGSERPFELSSGQRRPGEPYRAAPSARQTGADAPPSVRRTGDTKRPAPRSRRAGDAAEATGRLVVIVEDGSEGAVLELKGHQVDLGRTEGDVVFSEDRYMSPRHARLLFQNGAWHIRDLNSTNGVYRRLRKPEVLLDGDLVLLGLEVLQFELVDHAERGLGHATQHGTLVFGSPAASRPARLCQRTVEGIARDVYHLVSDETTIGREIGDIVFTSDPFMSRRHAVLKWQEASEQYVLADLNSSNGTYLAIRGDVRLVHGDFIRIGQHLFRVDLPHRADAARHEDR